MKTLFKFSSKALLALGLAGVVSNARADSIWTAEYSVALVSDKKAYAVGDIITVVVQESNTTSKDSSTKTSKKTALDASITSFLYTPTASTLLTRANKGGTGGRSLPAMKMSSANDFDGSGKINNTESIVARFGVRVVDVLPNGNLIIEGLRQTSFSGESRTVILRGTVRAFDITPENTVFSYNLADVSLKFQDSGALNNTQKKGWFGRVWEAVSPF